MNFSSSYQAELTIPSLQCILCAGSQQRSVDLKMSSKGLREMVSCRPVMRSSVLSLIHIPGVDMAQCAERSETRHRCPAGAPHTDLLKLQRWKSINNLKFSQNICFWTSMNIQAQWIRVSESRSVWAPSLVYL